jgi:hypothetical protein
VLARFERTLNQTFANDWHTGSSRRNNNICQIFADLSQQTVMLIGAGEMIELCAQHLNQKGVKKMIVANRTVENAKFDCAISN